jgi:3-oxoacyl-[acyl-carrier-protein] synthase II
MRHRVVVTGLGVVAPNGIGLEPYWRTLLACQSGIRPITLFNTKGYPLQIAGEVQDFDLSRFTDGRFNPKRLGRHTQLTLAAAQLAVRDARLERDDFARNAPVPVYVGVSTSAIDLVEHGMERLQTKGPMRVSPYVVSSGLPHAITSTLVESLGIEARGLTISSACQGGIDAVVTAYTTIRTGKADLAIAGGADAPITPLTVACFCASGLMPSRFPSPEKASRPFDRDRAGGIMAEAAGLLVLENLEHARARGVEPYCELTGYGSCDDAPGVETASGLAKAMSMAIANAGLMPADIEYVCAHGPSDPVIDRVETAMIKQVLGRRAYRIPVSSIKGVTGNPLAAQGPLQVIACAMSWRAGLIPPTANYENPDPDCDLDYVPQRPRRSQMRCCLVNVHGLGGGNCAVVLERTRR